MWDKEYRKKWALKNKEKIRAYARKWYKETFRVRVPAKANGRPRKDAMEVKIDENFKDDEINLTKGKGRIKHYDWDRT